MLSDGRINESDFERLKVKIAVAVTDCMLARDDKNARCHGGDGRKYRVERAAQEICDMLGIKHSGS